MMRTTEERVAAVKRRIGEINRRNRRWAIFAAIGAVLAAAAAIAALFTWVYPHWRWRITEIW